MEQEERLAGFSERAIAFSLDAGLFLLGYLATVHLLLNPYQAALWGGAAGFTWFALFLVYQVALSCEGRRSLGKAFLGLRVANFDHEPLDLAGAVLRTTAYLPGAILGLGFLWSLFNPSRQGWHDMVVGSVVLRDGGPPAAARLAALRAAAALCIAVWAGSWMWTSVWKPRSQRLMILAYAQVGLKQASDLQRIYHAQHGRYAGDLFSLSTASSDPDRFLNNIASLFDLREGFDIRTSPKGYQITAVVKDRYRTIMRHSGA